MTSTIRLSSVIPTDEVERLCATGSASAVFACSGSHWPGREHTLVTAFIDDGVPRLARPAVRFRESCKPNHMLPTRHSPARSSTGLDRCMWACAVLVCLATSLRAETPRSAEVETTPAARPISPPKSRGSISPRTTPPESAWWTTLGGLATVLTILGGVAWVVRKNLPGVPRGLPKSVVEVLGRKTLEPRAAIHLVRCGSRILVLGTTPQGMVSLAEITDAAEVDFVSGLCRTEDEADQHSFLDLIGKFRRGDDPRLDDVDSGDVGNPLMGEESPAPTTSPRTTGFDPAARLKSRMASDRRRDFAPVTETTSGEEGSHV